MNNAGVAQLAERQPSKLDVAGSLPVSRSISGGSQWKTNGQTHYQRNKQDYKDRVASGGAVVYGTMKVGSIPSLSAT